MLAENVALTQDWSIWITLGGAVIASGSALFAFRQTKASERQAEHGQQQNMIAAASTALSAIQMLLTLMQELRNKGDTRSANQLDRFTRRLYEFAVLRLMKKYPLDAEARDGLKELLSIMNDEGLLEELRDAYPTLMKELRAPEPSRPEVVYPFGRASLPEASRGPAERDSDQPASAVENDERQRPQA